MKLDDIMIERFVCGASSDATVRATHIPTGKTVVCDKYKSMAENKKQALFELEMLIESED